MQAGDKEKQGGKEENDMIQKQGILLLKNKDVKKKKRNTK